MVKETGSKPFDESVGLTVTKVLATARKYVGAPYVAQGRSRSGMDCGGLALVVGRETGYTDLEALGYSNSPDGESFEKLLQKCCEEVPVAETRAGDIFACDYGKGIQHTGFVAEVAPDISKKFGLRLKVVHAKRTRGVIEQTMHGYDMRAWVKTFRLRGIK
jgi:hypothetical protein